MKRRIEVAAHRGNVENAPENTMPAFTDAYGIDVDMIELDLRMTKDHEIVVIHDATVDRTSDGTGIVSDMTLAELKKLDFGVKYSEKFRGTRIPTFREFLKLTKRDKNMQFNFEFKDYIREKGDEFAKESADRIISLYEEYGITPDRLYINSFEGDLLLYINEKYGGKYRLHGYHPYSILGNNSDKASKILYCACLFYTADNPISPKETYDAVIAEGIHPWVGAGAVTEEQILRGAEYGGELFTSNHPTYVSEVLRKNGYR